MSESLPVNGYKLVAEALSQLGIKHMFGVIGIPVTQMASYAQAAGIRFISMRNEQAAGYAAAAAGFLTGVPGVLLTVSGPGAIHGIAGLSHASVNGFPLIMISGSAEQSELGKGGFQECDQVTAVRQFTKLAVRAQHGRQIPSLLAQAFRAALSGRPGATYVDLPSDVLMAELPPSSLTFPRLNLQLLRPPQELDTSALREVAQLLRSAKRPLVVVGEGAAFTGADAAIRVLSNRYGLPVLATSVGRGVVPDTHPLSVNAARSLALRKADVALVLGARLNWQLHFGEAPRWAEGCKFVLLDADVEQHDRKAAYLVVKGNVCTLVEGLLQQLAKSPGLNPAVYQSWTTELTQKVAAATRSLEARLSKTVYPLDYHTTLRVIRDQLEGVIPVPVVVSEGANTMDQARVIMRAKEGRTRLDAGTWGTMGVGPGSAIAAAVTQPDKLVVALEGDSAFGFSGMECETMVRYNLHIVVFVFNNGGIYGGDRRTDALRRAAEAGAEAAGFGSDPAPTDFVPNIRYDQLMTSFGGKGYHVTSEKELAAACAEAFANKGPSLVNVVIDSYAGVESGGVHAFNAPKAKL